jgi:hypothetical protein
MDYDTGDAARLIARWREVQDAIAVLPAHWPIDPRLRQMMSSLCRLQLEIERALGSANFSSRDDSIVATKIALQVMQSGTNYDHRAERIVDAVSGYLNPQHEPEMKKGLAP